MLQDFLAGKSRLVRICTGFLAIAIILYIFPLFHIKSLEEVKAKSEEAVFDVSAYVDNFWENILENPTTKPVEVADLLSALAQNPSAAASRFGRKLGLSSSTYYFISGSGYVNSFENEIVSIALELGGGTKVTIEIGPVFSNAIRDGSGLVDVSDFPNAQDFNAISSEINRRVEEFVFPIVQENSKPGSTIQFIGGVETTDGEAPSSIALIPLEIVFP